MKKLFGVIAACLVISAATYAQDTRKTDSERVRNTTTEVKAEDASYVEVYTVVELRITGDKITVKPMQSEGKYGNKYASRSYPEIERLSKLDLKADGEIDFLNVMGENNWKLITVTANTEDRTTTKTMYFSKSMPDTKSKTTSRDESSPNTRSTPAQRTPPAQR